MQEPQQVKRTRQRSREHPKIPLPQSLQHAKVVREYGGTLTVTDYAAALGYKSATTGPVIPKISNPPYYGLLSREGDTLRTTDLLDRLVTPETTEEEEAAKLEAFRHVAIYKKLIDLIGESGTKQDHVVENIAQRRLGIQPGAATQFVDVFVESAEWAGLARRLGDGSFELHAEPQPSTVATQTPTEEPQTLGDDQPVAAEEHGAQEPQKGGGTRPIQLHVHLHFDASASGDDIGDKLKALLVKIGDSEEETR